MCPFFVCSMDSQCQELQDDKQTNNLKLTKVTRLRVAYIYDANIDEKHESFI